MHPTPYLFFDGTCREAMTFYADVFDGTIEMMSPYSELPPGEGMVVREDRANWIMHAAIIWPDGGMLMASDDAGDDPKPMEGNSISMALPTVEAGRVAFERLSEGGAPGKPYGPTFWTPGFGVVRDRFGTRWMVTTSAEA
ncbi:MAG: VOC family protein [Pseudomonadota bacterium]